jgi:hypothetical protein
MNQVTQDYGTNNKSKEIILSGGNLEYAGLIAGELNLQITEAGDASAQLSNWALSGLTTANQNGGLLYWTLRQVTGVTTVSLYKESAHTNLVAAGSCQGNGVIHLLSQNASGISGAVTVAYTIDDTDAPNQLSFATIPTSPAWVGVGYTAADTGGTLTDKAPSFKEVKVTGQNDAVKRKALDRDVQFKVVLSQATLANMNLATGGNDATDVAASYFLGGKSQDAPLRTWRFTVQNDDDNTQDQRLIIPAGKVIDAVEAKYADGDAIGLALTIKAYETPSGVTFNGVSLTGFRYLISAASY